MLRESHTPPYNEGCKEQLYADITQILFMPYIVNIADIIRFVPSCLPDPAQLLRYPSLTIPLPPIRHIRLEATYIHKHLLIDDLIRVIKLDHPPSLSEPQRPQIVALLLRADLRALLAHRIVGEGDSTPGSGSGSEEVFGHPAELRFDAVAVLRLVEVVEGATRQPEVQPFHPESSISSSFSYTVVSIDKKCVFRIIQ